MQIDINSLTVYLSMTGVIAFLIARIIILRNKFARESAMHLQAQLDKAALLKKLTELTEKENSRELEQTDGFVNFLSTSREWAYRYIEEVQSALTEFTDAVEPTIEWSKSYGQVLGDNAHTEALSKISEAYDKLKEVLPKETETPNN